MKTRFGILLVALALLFLPACSAPFTAIGTTAGGLIGGSRGGTKGALLGSGAGMIVGAVADSLVFGTKTFQPRHAYANGRYYGYGIASCENLPTEGQRNRCNIGAERRAIDDERRSLSDAERFGYELGRGRY